MSSKKKPRRRSARSEKEHKLILKAKECNAWLKSVDKSLRKMEELAITPALHGEVWKEKTGRYYKERIRIMLDAPPVGMKKHAVGMLKRLEMLPW